MSTSHERLHAWEDGSPVHVKCQQLITEFAPDKFSEEQLNIIYEALQKSWNSGYKEGYDDGNSAGAEEAVINLRG